MFDKRIIEEISNSKGYSIALLTTFNFEISYFERTILNSLYDKNIRNIELLLVDDIFSNLSSNEKDKIIKFIKDLIKGNSCASLIMTDSAEVADKFGFNKKYLVYGSLCESKEGINN